MPSEEVHKITGRGGVRRVPFWDHCAREIGEALIGVFLQGGASVWSVGVLLISGKLTPCMASR